jgi:hypothetical protein
MSRMSSILEIIRLTNIGQCGIIVMEIRYANARRTQENLNNNRR